MTRVLVVAEGCLADFLVSRLRRHQFTVSVVPDGMAAMTMVRDELFDAALVDLAHSDVDGRAVIAHARAAGQAIPVIALSDEADTSAVVHVLDLGADDYLVKPIVFDELLARLRARLRGPASRSDVVLSVGELRLDARTRKAARAEMVVDLTAREYALLEVFLKHPNQILSRQQLWSEVWGYDFDPRTNVVEVYVRYLRNKLGGDLITTVRGIGYQLTIPDA